MKTVKARDREVIVDADGLINYTSLMKDIRQETIVQRNL